MFYDPEDLGHLAAAMAHDVRNPLNTIALHTEILEGLARKGKIVPAKLLASLQVLEREVERIESILDEYVEVVGPPEINLALGHIEGVLRKALEEAVTATPAPSARVELDLPKHLPQVLFDPEQLTRAFSALFKRSLVDADPQGQITITAEIDGSLVVSIHYPGPLLSPEEISRFFRIRKFRKGPCLSAARQIIKGHGGSLSISSSPEQKNTLTVSLPLV